MTSRAFCVPGSVFLLVATVLLIITSVSLPYLPAVDFVRSSFRPGGVSVLDGHGDVTSTSVSQLRLGIWSYCSIEQPSGNRDCSTTGYAYGVGVRNGISTATIQPSWTRGLAVHPVAAIVSFVALLLSLSTHITVTLLASLVSFLAAVLTLIAFAIDIALFASVKHKVRTLDKSFSTSTAPGFWMTFVAFILLLLAGCTVCFGRRRQTRLDNADPGPYSGRFGGFWNRFRRTPKY